MHCIELISIFLETSYEKVVRVEDHHTLYGVKQKLCVSYVALYLVINFEVCVTGPLFC